MLLFNKKFRYFWCWHSTSKWSHHWTCYPYCSIFGSCNDDPCCSTLVWLSLSVLVTQHDGYGSFSQYLEYVTFFVWWPSFHRSSWPVKKVLCLMLWVSFMRGEPTYVLKAKLQYGKKVPKFDPRSQQGKFVGYSPDHAWYWVAPLLILNRTTGKILPQFHCLFDDFFIQFEHLTCSTACRDLLPLMDLVHGVATRLIGNRGKKIHSICWHPLSNRGTWGAALTHYLH